MSFFSSCLPCLTCPIYFVIYRYFFSDYRREFTDKKDDVGSNSGKVETKFGNVISRGRVGTSSATNTVDILNGVVVSQNGSFDIDIVDEKKTPSTLAKFGGYDVVLAASASNSMAGSPYVDKKVSTKAKLFGGISNSVGGNGSKALLLFGNAAASPATSIRSGGLLLESSIHRNVESSMHRNVETTNQMNSISSPRMIAKNVSSPTCSEHQVHKKCKLA
jgi:hypothetical protein